MLYKANEAAQIAIQPLSYAVLRLSTLLITKSVDIYIWDLCVAATRKVSLFAPVGNGSANDVLYVPWKISEYFQVSEAIF